MKVIGIAGLAGSGKDSFHTALYNAYFGKKWVFNRKFAQPLKSGVEAMLGIDDIEEIKEDPMTFLGCKACPRDFLKILGAAVRNQVDKDVWVDLMRRNLAGERPVFYGKEVVCVVTDVRYSNEAHFIRGEMGGVIVRVERELWDDGTPFQPRSVNHESEVGLKDHEVDHVIVNRGDSIDDYYDEVVRFAEAVLFR